MSPETQTIVALGIVAIAAVSLLWSIFRKKKGGACGGGMCGAVSPEVKKLQARLKK